MNHSFRTSVSPIVPLSAETPHCRRKNLIISLLTIIIITHTKVKKVIHFKTGGDGSNETEFPP